MKFFKKFLVLVLIVLGIWGVNKYRVQKIKYQAGEEIQQEEKQPLRFAVMSDIHLDTESLEKGLKKAKENQVEFVIITGDLTSLGKKDELLKVKKVLDESGLLYYVVPGNHDLWASRQFKANVFREVFGKDFQSFEKDGLKFILVNDGGFGGIKGVKGLPAGPPVGRTGRQGDEGEGQGEWLEKELEECPQITCLVFLHMPLNHPNSLHVMGEGNEKVSEEAKGWVKFFTQEKVKEVFAGHLHYSSSYELDGLKTTVVGAITRDRNLQSPKFFEVEQEEERLGKKEIFVAD